jgi:hypothetical protein
MYISCLSMYMEVVMKGSHRPSQRIVLPNGMWVLLYDDDGSVKIAGYDRRFRVTEVLNRDGGAHVFIGVEPYDDGSPRGVAPRADDLVTVERRLVTALQRATPTGQR